MTKYAIAIPEFMNQGSAGPIVTLLQCFLIGAGFGRNKIHFDEQYGPVTAEAVKKMQRQLHIEADGHCGSETRMAMEDMYGFDLERAYSVGRTGRSILSGFMQPDDRVIFY